jgi:hypothetical protein
MGSAGVVIGAAVVLVLAIAAVCIPARHKDDLEDRWDAGHGGLGGGDGGGNCAGGGCGGGGG